MIIVWTNYNTKKIKINTNDSKVKIIFDNDAASDDVIAFIYLASHPNISIEGITIAGTGEAHGADGARNMADLCYFLRLTNIPIAYGSEKPYDSNGKPFPYFLRKMMDDLFKEMKIPKNPNPDISSSAVMLMKKIISSNHEKITFLATGPLTNIAEFIKAYPYLKNKIEKIVIMGGAIHVKGNIQEVDSQSKNAVAEWNIYADPKAAQIVFSSNIPIILVPLDATNQVPITKDFYKKVSQDDLPNIKLIYRLFKDIVDLIGEDLFFKKFYLWDPLAAIICLDPDVAITKKMAIQMNLETAQIKQVDPSIDSSSIINIATNIPRADRVLGRMINEIHSGSEIHQNK
jgi:inosine-uridine nucleoside N-ribohydrolase